MKEYRASKNETARYTSLEDLRKGFGLKPLSHQTKDSEKLKSQREKFAGKCRVCGAPLVYIKGTNVLACQSEKCKGIKMTGKNEDGTERAWYIPVTRTLDEHGMDIAMNLFA